MQIPSSYTERASALKPTPPTSTVWQVDANSATGRPSRNTGVTMTKSNRCPVPIQGSLVTKTSPGRIDSSGKREKKCFTAAAIELTWPGVPVTACASMLPRVS